MPQYSIVGMLMEQYEPYKVIYSNGFTITQHDPFTWEIDDDDFKYTDDITDMSKHNGAIIKNWLYSNDEETRKIFIDAFFSILLKTNASSFQELLNDIKDNAPIILSSIKTSDPDARRTVTKTLYPLFTIIANELKKNTAEKLSDIQIQKPKFMQKDELQSLISSRLRGK